MDDRGLLDENLRKDDDNNSINKDETRIKILNWSPDFLQHFNSINWFLLTMALASLTQGIVINGLSVVTLPAIEKEFGISSKSAGIIVAGNDAAAMFLCGIVSFFGGKAHKPKWIGMGVLLTGFGGFLFAAPKLMIDAYQPVGDAQKVRFDTCLQNKTLTNPVCETNGSLLYVVIMFVAQVIMGAGVTPLYTLGPAFLDENVDPKSSPIYLGIWFVSSMLGPGLGFLLGGQFLKVFTNIEMNVINRFFFPEKFKFAVDSKEPMSDVMHCERHTLAPEGISLKPSDPRWIGAWWIGFVIMSTLFFLSGFLLMMFPKQLPNAMEKRQKAMKEGAIPKSDPSIEYTIKGFFKALAKICLNKVYILAVLGLTVRLMFVIGLASFLVKILIVKFGVPPYRGGTLIGMVMVPSMTCGILIGSFLMKKIKVILAPKSAAKICLVIALINIPVNLIYLIPACSNTQMAGVHVSYANTTSMTGVFSKCNTDCTCKKQAYAPVCGSDGITYKSPCFAGCQVISKGKNNQPLFGNCTCIGASYNESNGNKVATKSNFYNHATLGVCDRGCKNLIVFTVVIIIGITISFIAGTPHKILLIRSVPDNQRSFAFGVQFFILRSLAFLPSPIVMGAVVDSQCTSWIFNSCGEKKNCADYNVDKLSSNIATFGIATACVAALLYGIINILFRKSDHSSKDKSIVEEYEV